MFVPSQALCRQLSDMLGIAEGRLTVLANGLDIQDLLRRADAPAELPPVPGGSVVLLWRADMRWRRSDGREISDMAFLGRIAPLITATDERVRWAEQRRYMFELAPRDGS